MPRYQTESATIGTLSIIAVARPVTRLMAPGPLVAIATPTPPVTRLNPSAAWAPPCSWRTRMCRSGNSRSTS